MVVEAAAAEVSVIGGVAVQGAAAAERGGSARSSSSREGWQCERCGSEIGARQCKRVAVMAAAAAAEVSV